MLGRSLIVERTELKEKMFTQDAFKIFEQAIADYHKTDDVHTPMQNPYQKDDMNYWLYLKAWIDTVQWHLEDLIRDPAIDPIEGMKLKRRIDASNQERTDVVEYLDDYFYGVFDKVEKQINTRLNTESPAWAIDRLSILALKIYHMAEQAMREDASAEHRQQCQAKLEVLEMQKADLISAIEQLLVDMEHGLVIMKQYKQMKMYNDPSTNPVLYKK